jgi:threonine dehydrogenase-like Zn-dependent dehydrogenase
MRAAVATGSSIEVRDDVADPTPGPGQVLVHTIVCGICGSDLHALAAPEEMAQLNAAGGAASVVHPGDPYVLGHEFTAEIVDNGPETGGTLRVGSAVCALAMQLGADIVLDPAEGTGFPDFADLGVPANSLQRSASIGMGSEPPRAVIFEAVGRQGMIPNIIDAAPPGSRIVVAGVNTQGDRFVPALTSDTQGYGRRRSR